MDSGNRFQNGFSIEGLGKRVVEYLVNLPPETLEVTRCAPVEILAMTPGAYNLNKYPPAEPEVLRLLAPQRGLIAIG